MSKIYIAGPMTNYPNYNWDKFYSVEKTLREKGIVCVNPARVCDDCGGKNIFLNDELEREKILEKELNLLKECDTILLLDGWNNSKGCKKELYIALKNNLNIIMEKDI